MDGKLFGSSILKQFLFVSVQLANFDRNRRDARQEEHNHILVLSRAVRGHHVHDTDSTEDAVLFFQFNRPVCTDIIDGAAGIHTAT